jgi:hypothetical protein
MNRIAKFNYTERAVGISTGLILLWAALNMIVP